MNTYAMAQSAYARGGQSVRTERDTEYAVFAQITRDMKAIDEADETAFPRIADAVERNVRLWNVLSEDLSLDSNQLPAQLRAQLISLALFVKKHTHAVLQGSASLDALIEINTAVMRGLRGGAS